MGSITCQRLDAHQQRFGAAGDGAGRDHPQSAVVDEALQPDAHRRQVADDLGAIGVEADEQRAVAAFAGGLGKGSAERGLGGAREAGDQHAGAAVVAAAQHGVEPFHAGRDPFQGDRRVHPSERSRHRDVEAGVADDEGRFILVEARTPEFLHAQVALRDAQGDLVIEHDRAVDHELHEIQRVIAGLVPPLLGGDQAGQPVVQQPAMQAVHLGATCGGVGQQRQQDVQRVEHDPARAHCAGLGPQRRQHAGEVEGSALHHVGRGLGVQEEEPGGLQLRQWPGKAGEVGGNARRRLLERDEDPRLAAIGRAVDQELHCEDGLAGAGAAGQQRRAARGHSAPGHLVEPGDSGGGLGGGCGLRGGI
jgi:hypothetical protein